MSKEKFLIQQIPAVLWGDRKEKLIVAIHGAGSHKEDTVIAMLADQAQLMGYQVLSFDLREHGERKEEILDRVEKAVKDLSVVMEYAMAQSYQLIDVFACSMGAYFAMMTFGSEKFQNIHKMYFLSPVISMRQVIENMMQWSGVSKQDLEQKQVIALPKMGQTLYQPYYQYVCEHPIQKWKFPTAILYGTNDMMTTQELIHAFSEKYSCELTELQDAEHYFHTPEQLAVYQKWLQKNIGTDNSK